LCHCYFLPHLLLSHYEKAKNRGCPKANTQNQAEQPVVSVDAVTNPKKMTKSQKVPKKAKAVSPKALAQNIAAATPKHASLPWQHLA
jgi:hypothetical protein